MIQKIQDWTGFVSKSQQMPTGQAEFLTSERIEIESVKLNFSSRPIF